MTTVDDVQLVLDIPKLDGYRADTLKVAVGGGVELEIMDEEAIRFFRSLKLLQDVTLSMTATVVGNGWKASRGEDDDEKVVNAIQIKVHSLDIPES
jgi:hypothetical protein